MYNEITNEEQLNKELKFTDNYVFSAVLRENKDICIQLLENVLGFEIKDLKYIDSEKTEKPSSDSHVIRMDVFTKDEKNIYNVEMQTYETEGLARRTRYYQSAMDTVIFKQGKDYEELQDSYIIMFCTFDPFQKDYCMYSFEKTCNEVDGLKLNDGSKVIILNAKGSIKNVESSISDVLEYMKTGKACGDNLAGRIDEAVRNLSEEEKRRAQAVKYEADMMDAKRAGYKEGIATGRAEGIATGRAEGMATVAKTMLGKGYSIEEVTEVTGLSKEEIEKAVNL